MKYLILVVMMLSGCGTFNIDQINTAIKGCKNNGGLNHMTIDALKNWAFCENGARIDLNKYNKENK